MADKRKRISGSVLRKMKSIDTPNIKEKTCSYTHIILLFLLYIYNITFFTYDTAGMGKDDRSMSHESHLMTNKTFIPIEIN